LNLGSRFGLYSLAGCVTLLPLLVLPAMVGVLVDGGVLDEGRAGWAASLGFFGSAAISMVLAFFMHRVDLRKIATGALVLAAAGDAMSAMLGAQPELLLVTRFVTGMGTGAAYTAIVAAFARERHVDRGYGAFITLQFIISGVGLYLLTVNAEALGYRGMYLTFAARV
jgi:MFS family permease